MMEESQEPKTTNSQFPFIKLIAGKPTRDNKERRYGWEIKLLTKENPSESDIKEIKKLNDKMIKDFGHESDKGSGE